MRQSSTWHIHVFWGKTDMRQIVGVWCDMVGNDVWVAHGYASHFLAHFPFVPLKSVMQTLLFSVTLLIEL